MPTEVRIIGKPKTGKTIMATVIAEALKQLGASVLVKDMDEPKHVAPGSKPLLDRKITVRVVYVGKR